VRWLPAFIALAIAHTWPLAADPHRWSRHDNADALLNEWALAWIAHVSRTNVWQLFEANIFHPEPRALAFSEHLFTQSLLSTPLLWLGASTLLAHNLVILAGLVLTGWTMAYVIHAWTGDRWAGLLAGCLLAFNANSLTRLAHVQAMHVEFLPLALYGLDRLLARRGWRDVLLTALTATLQALCSGYLLVMTALSLAVGAIVRAIEWARPARWPTLAALAIVALLATAATAPFLVPYYRVRQEQGLVRPLDEVALYSATPAAYLSTAGRIHYRLWSHAFFGPDSLFPGLTASLLVLGSVVTRRAMVDPRARMLLAIGAVGIYLSFGPRAPGYRWLYDSVPMLQGLRGAARFGFLGLFAAAGLAGFGLADLRRAVPSIAHPVALAAVILVNLEAARAPLGLTPAHAIPKLYDDVAAGPPGAVVELPLPGPAALPRNAPYVLASTRHFRPLLNGYSGFVPASYIAHADALSGFPNERSRAVLAQLNVTQILVHADRESSLARAADETPWLDLVATSGSMRLYRYRSGREQ
jgi:hypothetical protein